MKKLKLFFAACALLLGVSNASASTDVTSTYLTDATLTDENTNWALNSSGGNHNWNGDYKYHESWHNTFSLSQTVTVPNGYYQISIQAVNSVVPSTNAKLTAVSGGNSASAYIRHSSAGGFGDIAKQFSLNSDACRIYATVKVENGSLTVGFSQPNNAEWIVYGQFKLYSLTETEYKNAIIFQTALESNANSWSADWTNGGNQYSYGRERFNETAYDEGKIIYKTFSDLPLGNYDVTVHAKANVAWRTAAAGNDIAEVYVNEGKYSIPVEDKTGYDLTPEYCYTFENVEVANGNIEAGIRNIATGGNWYNVALVKLLYKGGSVAADAVALPDGGDMEAGTWYYFDIAVAGDNYNATATDLSKIICTTNGNQLSPSATGNITLNAENNSLSAIRYYVKSSTNNNLEIAATSFNYNVGDPTLSVANGGYTQNSTFTVTFPDAATDDPDAEVALVASSTATVNGNSVDLEATTGGFTLSLGSLTANTNYVIAIPANVYGYAGESMNSAINITIHTPAVFDGVYYLYDATNKLFLGRGANYGSRAVADKYGVAMNVATNASGISTFTFVDGGNNKLFDANGGLLYTDNTTYPNFAFEATTGGCYVVNKNTTASSTFDGKLYIEGSNVIVSTTNSTVWSLLTDAQRDAIVDAYPTDNINTVIAAAGISTTAAEFESFLATNYGATDKTSLIGTAKFAGSVGDWTWTQVRGQDNQPAYGTNFAELWNATGTYNQTVGKAGLPAGIYKVTVDGYERRATVAISNELGGAGYNLVSSYLAANNEQVRLTDWYNTSKPGNTSGAVTAFNNGEATNELYIYLDGSTDLEIKLVKPNYVWDCWTIFNNFTLTYYEAKATPAEKTALADAIDAAEGKTLGFENGEYAPYNNVDACVALAAAKAIDPETASGSAVVAATDALKGATWTANVGEVNAVYDGTFGLQAEHTTGPTTLNGWNNPEGIRQLIKNTTTYPGLNSATDNAAVFAWGNTTMTYGDTDGYTMPLAAHTIYEIVFKTCGWSDGDMGYVNVTVLNASSEGMAQQTTATATKRITEENPWNEFRMLFVTGEAGNYRLGMWTSKHTVFTDISITKAASQVLEISEKGLSAYAPGTYPSVKLTRTIKSGYNTLVLPFDMTQTEVEAKFGAGSVVYKLNSFENEVIGFQTADGVTANTPCILKAANAGTEYSFTDCGVDAATPSTATAGAVTFNGSYAASFTVPANDENYIVSGGKLYLVDSDNVTIAGTRAYFNVVGNQARSISFDGVLTGITTVENGEVKKAFTGDFYDLSGRKVKNPSKGIYVVEGKKVVF